MNGEAGKGDDYRKVNREKFDDTMLRLYGVECPECRGTDSRCSWCDGAGLVERWVYGRWWYTKGQFDAEAVKSKP